MGHDADWPLLLARETGLRGLCPRCGKGHIFNGFLSLKPTCEVCGLDHSFADPADGPAFFALCFGSVPAAALAVWIEIVLDPPFWMHLLVSLPFLIVTAVLPLRPLKGWLVARDYLQKAEREEASRRKPGAAYGHEPSHG